MPQKDRELFLTHARWFVSTINQTVTLGLLSDNKHLLNLCQFSFAEMVIAEKNKINACERAEQYVFNELATLKIPEPPNGGTWIVTDAGWALEFWRGADLSEVVGRKQ